MSTTETPIKDFPKPPYETRVLEHAVCLIVSGVRFIGTKALPTHKLFVFEADARIDDLIVKFINDELLLNARDVFRIWRDLRSMTYSANCVGFRGSR